MLIKDHTPAAEDLPDRARIEVGLRALVRAAADLASFCEHVEHNESHSVGDVARAAANLRRLAEELSLASGLKLSEAYRRRIRRVEESSLLRLAVSHGDAPCLVGAEAVDRAKTWDEIQIAQIQHDKVFHPDVFGLSKLDQVRHYTFHVTKLGGLLVDALDNDRWSDFADGRLADIAIFGVKLATVCNVRLPSSPIDPHD
jgi:hypothetical protein